MRKSNKKKGASLIIVLMVLAVAMILSSVTLTTISKTTKANVDEKKSEDLLYSAESGLEYGIGVVKNNININSQELVINNTNVKVDILEIESKKKYRITSTAGSKIIETVLEREESEMISNYGYYINKFAYNCDNININVNGSKNTVYAPINLLDGSSSNQSTTNKEMFDYPSFNLDKVPYKSNVYLEAKKKNLLNELLDEFTHFKHGQYDVILANVDNLTLNVTGAISLQKVIIITSGNITIINRGSCNMQYSSILAKNITFDLTGAYDANRNQQSVLGDFNIQEFDTQLSVYLQNNSGSEESKNWVQTLLEYK